MNTIEHPASAEAPHPPWRDEYFRDVAALEMYSEKVAAWQRNSGDPFERADAELWSRVSLLEACAIFRQLFELLPVWDATGQLDAAHIAENEARRERGLPPVSLADFRRLTVRTYLQFQILDLLPASEA
jgi:hypothetical protein